MVDIKTWEYSQTHTHTAQESHIHSMNNMAAKDHRQLLIGICLSFCSECDTRNGKSTESHGQHQESDGDSAGVRKANHQKQGRLHTEACDRVRQSILHDVIDTNYSPQCFVKV